MDIVWKFTWAGGGLAGKVPLLSHIQPLWVVYQLNISIYNELHTEGHMVQADVPL